MWNKIKNILAGIGGAFVAAMLFCLGRRSIYGSAGDSSESALGQLGKGIDKCEGEVKHAEERIEAGKGGIDRGEEGIDRSAEIAGEIEGNLERAEDHAGAIREILKQGKKTEPVGEG